MSYENSPACKLLCSQCVICGRPLVDARSCQMGVGPECVKRIDVDITGGIDEGTRKVANKYIYDAAVAAQEGRIEEVLRCAETIEGMGLESLADKIRHRFKKAAERESSIVIESDGVFYRVKTPFRRGDKKAFVAAWRKIPGRRYRDEVNFVPISQKKALWELLREFFGGKYGRGPKGVFRIPQPEPKPVQMELGVTA
jgi:hypothetical protein